MNVSDNLLGCRGSNCKVGIPDVSINEQRKEDKDRNLNNDAHKSFDHILENKLKVVALSAVDEAQVYQLDRQKPATRNIEKSILQRVFFNSTYQWLTSSKAAVY